MQMVFVAVLLVLGGIVAILHFLHARGYFKRRSLRTIDVPIFASRRFLGMMDIAFVVLVILYALVYLA